MKTTIIVILAATNIATYTAYLSLTFRRNYLRQKCENRMNAEEIKQIDKTDHFWRFLLP